MGKGYEKYVKRTINRNNKEVFMKEQKRALITGCTGQDGSFLAQQLLNKDYQVFGLVRYTSAVNYDNIHNILDNEYFHIVYGDLGDQNSLYRAHVS